MAGLGRGSIESREPGEDGVECCFLLIIGPSPIRVAVERERERERERDLQWKGEIEEMGIEGSGCVL